TNASGARLGAVPEALCKSIYRRRPGISVENCCASRRSTKSAPPNQATPHPAAHPRREPAAPTHREPELNVDPPALIRPYLIAFERSHTVIAPEIDLIYDRMVERLRDHLADPPELREACIALDNHLKGRAQLPSPWASARSTPR
ncbi:hypothetical protein, partial [Thermobifida fusca]|uniref:hypothetical protein n=1 Tax=Thermobifida fusca TaxID=2021 RepID=UPI001F213BD6